MKMDKIETTQRRQERDGKLPPEIPDLCISSCLLVPGRRKAGQRVGPEKAMGISPKVKAKTSE